MTATFTYDFDSFSDLHKEAYGFRPSQVFYEWMQVATSEELQEQWDWLCNFANMRARELEEDQWQAQCLLEAQLAKTCADHNVDIATAIRWLDDAHGTRGDYQFLDYYLGVKYGTIEGMLGIKGRNLG